MNTRRRPHRRPPGITSANDWDGRRGTTWWEFTEALVADFEREVAQLEALRRGPLIPLARRGRAHTGRGLDDITKVVASFMLAHPKASIPEIRAHLRALAESGNEIVRAVGVGRLPAVGRLREFQTPLPRLSTGWRDVDSAGRHVLSDAQLVSTVKRLRRKLRRLSR